jgi:hypothetical protein
MTYAEEFRPDIPSIARMYDYYLGSYLVISHATADAVPECANVTQVYENATSRLRIRTHAEVEALFAGCELVDPGEVAWLHDWHPDPGTPSAEETGPSVSWCGVARKA